MLVGNFVNLPRTNLGPLTTTFIPPAACAVNVAQCATCSTAWQGQHCGEAEPDDTTSCWPQATAGVVSPTAPFLGWGFFSPGIVCPAGYTTACSATKGPSGTSAGWDVEFSMLLGETAIGCCPTGYTCGNNYGNTCFIQATATTISTVICSNGSSNLGFKTVPDQDIGISTYTLLAPMFQLNWQSSDRPGSTGAQETTGIATRTSASSGSQTGTGAADQTGSAAGSGTSGLSSGAAAGIAVGATILALAVVGAAFLLWKRRRTGAAAAPLLQSPDIHPPQPQGYQEYWAHKPELSSERDYYEMSLERAAQTHIEMPANPGAHR